MKILTKKSALHVAISIVASATSIQAQAALSTNATLSLDAGVGTCVLDGIYPACKYGAATFTGSWFQMRGNANTAISNHDGIILGMDQPASGSHTGIPNGSENPGIDAPWEFFGNTGMHQTLSGSGGITIISDDGAGDVILDFSKWNVTWNAISSVDLGTGVHPGFDSFGAPSGQCTVLADGQAKMTCASTCETGDAYELVYCATVLPGDSSGYGGVFYTLNLTGTISGPPLDASVIVGPKTLNLTSNGNGFSLSLELTDPDNGDAIVDPADINDCVSIVSIGGMPIPAGDITETAGNTTISGNTLVLDYSDPATGNRQDIIAVIADAPHNSSVEVCASGTAQDAGGNTRDFEACDTITIKNKGNR